MKNPSRRKVTLYDGEDIIYTALFWSGLLAPFPCPMTITTLKIEEIENPQNPKYRLEHLSEESIG